MMDLVPERLRGETATFDIVANGAVVVETGRRVTARHIRQLEKTPLPRLRYRLSMLLAKLLPRTTHIRKLARWS